MPDNQNPVTPANREKIEIKGNRKIVRVDTVSVPVMVSGNELRKRYAAKQRG